MIHKTLILLSALFLSFALPAESEFEKFARTFAPPKEMQETIEQNKEKLEEPGAIAGSVFYKGPAINPAHVDGSKCEGVCRHNAGFSRIVNAYRMVQCIKQYNLNLFTVPNKYIYFVNDRWQIFTEALKPDEAVIPSKIFNLTLVKQLTKLTEETGFEDFGYPLYGNETGHLGRNMMYKDGKLFFIDTEDVSFMDAGFQKRVPSFWSDLPDWYWAVTYISGVMPHNCKAQYIETLYHHLHVKKQFLGSHDAYVWLRDRLNYLLHSAEGLMHKKILPHSTEFDNADINFNKARQELKNIEYHTSYRKAFDRDCVESGDITLSNDVNWCKKLMASMAAIDKKLQEKYGAQPRKDMQDPKRQEAAERWRSV